jgi:winged helix DNA-binding protein
MDRHLARRRAAAQLLHRPEPLEPATLVRRLLAVQAQDGRAAALALRARNGGLTLAAVQDAGDLVVAWLSRGTLHLVHRYDHPWLLALTAPARTTANDRRLRQEGVPPGDADRAVAVVADAVAEGPQTRAELAARLAAAGIRTEGQATPHLLMRAALRGVTVMDPRRRFVPVETTPPVDRDGALAELARRYLAAHAPATDRDLAAWSGLPLRDARVGLRAAGEPAPPAPGPIGPRLLGPFDPYLLGWKDRAFAVPEGLARTVHPGGGMVRAVATVDGIVVGDWEAADERFAAERADVERFLSPGAQPAS